MIKYLIIFSVIVLSGGVFILVKPNKHTVKLLLSFSGSYLLAICFLSLIPEVYYSENGKRIGLVVLIGFLIQIIIEFFSEGIEHGHVHPSKKGIVPFAMLLALSLHAFLEGMPIAGNDARAVHHDSLFIGILLHKIPVAIALVSLLLASSLSRKKTLFILTFFACMTPLGAIMAGFVGTYSIMGISFTTISLALTIGIFLHIATTILFESAENHRFNLIKLLTIIVGCFIAFLTAH